MPTVLRKNEYRFFIPTLDHAPAHVHVDKSEGEGEAKFELASIGLINSDGFRMNELAEIEQIIAAHQQELLASWNEIHPTL